MMRRGETSTFGGGAEKFIVRCCSKRQRSESGEEETVGRPNPNLRSAESKSKKSVTVKRDPYDNWYSVDLGDLLFTPDRDFLIRNNGEKVSAHHLQGKTILLFIVPIYEWLNPGEILDVVEAYHELLPLGGTEFVFVPVYIPHYEDSRELELFKLHLGDDFDLEFPSPPTPRFASKEALFNHLFSTIPFPAVPFSDIEACGDRVLHTFSADPEYGWNEPHWVILDPTSTVVATREHLFSLFKLFGGAELYPLSYHRLATLWYDFPYGHPSREYRRRLIAQWDQLLASPTRDYLLSSDGHHVPISSLKGKLIGLYFCENIPCPPRIKLINKVYQEAKLRGYDFEIVQINFHYEFFNAIAGHTLETDFSVQQHYENINWLTLPFKDPSCRKLQRIFQCKIDRDHLSREWQGDCLVIIDPRHESGHVLFEFSGAEVIQRLGIEGYPFTGQSLLEREYTRLTQEIRLELLFPPGLCQFTRHVGGGRFDLVNDSQLKGKRVLVLFVKPSVCKHSTFMSSLKSKYLKQAQEDDKFEVVYVSMYDDGREDRWLSKICEQARENKFEAVHVSMDDEDHLSHSFIVKSFSECTRDMPWLVHPYYNEFGSWWSGKIFKTSFQIEAAAFGIDGKLIAKDTFNSEPVQMGHQFPFISPDLKGSICKELIHTFSLDRYYDEQCIYED